MVFYWEYVLWRAQHNINLSGSELRSISEYNNSSWISVLKCSCTNSWLLLFWEHFLFCCFSSYFMLLLFNNQITMSTPFFKLDISIPFIEIDFLLWNWLQWSSWITRLKIEMLYTMAMYTTPNTEQVQPEKRNRIDFFSVQNEVINNFKTRKPISFSDRKFIRHQNLIH